MNFLRIEICFCDRLCQVAKNHKIKYGTLSFLRKLPTKVCHKKGASHDIGQVSGDAKPRKKRAEWRESGRKKTCVALAKPALHTRRVFQDSFHDLFLVLSEAKKAQKIGSLWSFEDEKVVKFRPKSDVFFPKSEVFFSISECFFSKSEFFFSKSEISLSKSEVFLSKNEVFLSKSEVFSLTRLKTFQSVSTRRTERILTEFWLHYDCI